MAGRVDRWRWTKETILRYRFLICFCRNFAEDNAIFAFVMAKNYFKSYIWLLETLQSRGPLTLSEIKKLWMGSSINDEGRELATRTFSNHVASIADIFGIDIVCDRRDNTYSIANAEDMDGHGLRAWMLDALTMNSLLNESARMRDRIFFESVPSSRHFLTTVIQAIRDNRKIRVTYQGYKMPEPRTMDIEPYFIREFKRRWYLYGHTERDDSREPHMYALDRMLEVEVLQENFELPEDFDAESWFKPLYGVRKYEGMQPGQVLLKVYGKQVNYFRSLPLHGSQEEVEVHDGYSIFSYHLAPDYDFKQDVLSFGDSIEVLEPEILREDISKIVNRLIDRYI